MEARQYESVVIMSPKLNDSQLKDEIKKFEGILASANARVTGVDHWGKKELAFLLKKERYGHYVAIKFETENHDATAQLESILRITDTVHKFQTHRINSRTRKFKGNPKRAQQSGSDDDFDDSSDFND